MSEEIKKSTSKDLPRDTVVPAYEYKKDKPGSFSVVYDGKHAAQTKTPVDCFNFTPAR